jgi:hypothetical protein
MTSLLAVLTALSLLGAPDAGCRLSASNGRFFQAMLDDWATITGEIFRLPSRELPWIVLFDRGCGYYLASDTATAFGRSLAPVPSARLAFAGTPVDVRTAPVADTVPLPNGAAVPVQGLAFTSVYERRADAVAFFVTALPDVWAHDPRYAADTTNGDEFVRGVLSHELVHTLQMVSIRDRIERLVERYPNLPGVLDDDLIQRRFEQVPGVDSSMRAEIDLLYRAAAEPAAGRARELGRDALDHMSSRRARFYADSAAAYTGLEELYLNMEGVASWGALQLARRRAPRDNAATVLDRIRDNRKWWSQEEGLALYLLVDRFVPGWVGRTMPPELASPVTLLREELGLSR